MQGTPQAGRQAHILVLGNEKGGSGKTTVAMHVLVGLLRLGFSVASLDLDPRQRSLTRYLDNRRRWAEKAGVALPCPEHHLVERSALADLNEAVVQEHDRLKALTADLSARHHFLVIDCPGADTPLARQAHLLADTLITPLNDSLVDFDLLAELEPEDRKVVRAGVYARMILECRRERLARRQSGMDWLVLRNRMSHLADRNKRQMVALLGALSRQYGFRLAKGFGERVIFRQLFLDGLTVLDYRTPGVKLDMTMSHVVARQEIRELLTALWLPRVAPAKGDL